MAISLRANRLRAAASAEEYALHRAAIEWDLDASLSINDPSDIESRKHWSEQFEPFEHQIQNLITFCRRAPVALIADDVGLGKTISAGLILSELFTRRRVRRALVICPKILLLQWKEELGEKFRISAEYASGVQLDAVLRSRRSDVVITTYDSARDRISAIKSAGFDALILDEAHKLRNLHGQARGNPPRFATAIREVLAERVFKYVVMLTATPVKNRLWDLYSLIDCLTVAKGHKNPLGSRDEFARRYLSGVQGVLQLHPGRREEFRRILAGYMVRTRRSDARLQFPGREVRTLRGRATGPEAQLMASVGRALPGLAVLLQISLAQALMSSPEALLAQLNNMRSGVDPELLAATGAAVGSGVVTSKMQLLRDVIETLRAQAPASWRAVVFTIRKETQNAIGRHLEGMGIKVGYIRGAQAPANERSIRDFHDDPPGINVLVSTDTGAEGVNLQVANVVVNYDLPWDPMVVEQRIGRVQRLKSKFENVVVFNLTVAGSVEERVVARLLEKLQLIAHTVGDVEAILESVSEKQGDENALEGTIERLVISALIGADVEKDLRLAAESIDRAKRIYEDERQVVESQLGDLDEMHRVGPRMPKLTRATPSMAVRDFVLRGLAAVDGRVTPAGGSFYRAALPGRAPFLFSFEEDGEARVGGIISVMPTRHYVEGRPDFTRLVGEWTKRSEHRVLAGSARDERLKEVAQTWCRDIEGARVVAVSCARTEPAFQGKLLFRVAASVAHDRYEKLLELDSAPQGHPRIDLGGPLAAQPEQNEVDPGGLVTTLSEDVTNAAGRDAELGKFLEFYNARLQEELRAAAGRPDLEKRAEDSFGPMLAAELVGAEGLRYVDAATDVDVEIDGAKYSARFQIVPEAGLVLSGPPQARCAVSGRVVPEAWLERCVVSGDHALRHLMVTSAVSGRKAMPAHASICPISGEPVLAAEMETSSVSGRRGMSTLFASSGVSGARALHDELVACDFTGVLALPMEVAISDVSGRRFRVEEGRKSAVSGKAGHSSEFLRCSVTEDWILLSESGVSAMSNRAVRSDLLVRSEKAPGRLGLPDELVICSQSGRQLLEDEVVTSAVSGVLVDRDLAVQSQVSSRWAMQDEIVVCEESGVPLLPDETASCALSGRRVDNRLLAPSAASGLRALERLMDRCAATGRLALPNELASCEISGQRVLPSELETCVVTGRRAQRARLVQSAVSGVYVSPEKASRSTASGRWCAPNEVVRCTWTQNLVLPDEARLCAITGLRLDARLVNASGEFQVLRALLDGQEHGSSRPDLLPWLKLELGRRLRGISSVHVVASPNGESLAAAIETRAFLGLKTRLAGVVARVTPERRVIGRCVEGRRGPENWIPEREV